MATAVAAAAAVAVLAVMNTTPLLALQQPLQQQLPLQQLVLPLQTLTAAYCTIAVLQVTRHNRYCQWRYSCTELQLLMTEGATRHSGLLSVHLQAR
jgi:hypothetical protein